MRTALTDVWQQLSSVSDRLKVREIQTLAPRVAVRKEPVFCSMHAVILQQVQVHPSVLPSGS